MQVCICLIGVMPMGLNSKSLWLPCRVIWAAVFDGHAGKQVAALASNQLHDNVASSGFLDASNIQVGRCTPLI